MMTCYCSVMHGSSVVYRIKVDILRVLWLFVLCSMRCVIEFSCLNPNILRMPLKINGLLDVVVVPHVEEKLEWNCEGASGWFFLPLDQTLHYDVVVGDRRVHPFLMTPCSSLCCTIFNRTSQFLFHSSLLNFGVLFFPIDSHDS
jgi:hypothetical protein